MPQRRGASAGRGRARPPGPRWYLGYGGGAAYGAPRGYPPLKPRSQETGRPRMVGRPAQAVRISRVQGGGGNARRPPPVKTWARRLSSGLLARAAAPPPRGIPQKKQCAKRPATHAYRHARAPPRVTTGCGGGGRGPVAAGRPRGQNGAGWGAWRACWRAAPWARSAAGPGEVERRQLDHVGAQLVKRAAPRAAAGRRAAERRRRREQGRGGAG